MMPSNTQNNVDIEEGLSTSPPSPIATSVSAANTTTVNYGTGLELTEGLDIEDGLVASPPATQNITGSSPFTLASTQTDDSSPADAIASNYAASIPSVASAATPMASAGTQLFVTAAAATTSAGTQLFSTDSSPAANATVVTTNHAAAAVTARPVAVMADTTRFEGAGLELIDKDSGPPLPTSMTEESASSVAAALVRAPTLDLEDELAVFLADMAARRAKEAATGTEPVPPVKIGAADNYHDAASASLPAAATLTPSTEADLTSTARIPSAGPELTDEGRGAHIPNGMTEASSNAVEGGTGKNPMKVVSIEDDDGPDPPTVLLEYPDDAKRISVSSNTSNTQPTPFNSVDFEDGDNDTKKKIKETMASDEESLINSTRSDIEDEDEEPPPVISTNMHAGPMDTDLHEDEEDITQVDNSNRRNDATNEPDLERNSLVRVPEAWAVVERADEVTDRESVYIATHLQPTVPWRRRKLLLGAVLIVVALTIALGVSLSSNEPVANPSVTVVANSDAPSLSMTPSSSPTKSTPIPTNPPTFAPTFYCKRPQCTTAIWNTSVCNGNECYTCGNRIRFKQTYEGGSLTELDACAFVSNEFINGPCGWCQRHLQA